MAIDNSSYDAIESIYFKIKTYLETIKLGPEHSPIIIKHEDLATLLESFDVEALEEQTKDIHALHLQLDTIIEVTNQIIEDLKDTSDSVATAKKIADGLNTVFEKIHNIAL